MSTYWLTLGNQYYIFCSLILFLSFSRVYNIFCLEYWWNYLLPSPMWWDMTHSLLNEGMLIYVCTHRPRTKIAKSLWLLSCWCQYFSNHLSLVQWERYCQSLNLQDQEFLKAFSWTIWKQKHNGKVNRGHMNATDWYTDSSPLYATP